MLGKMPRNVLAYFDAIQGPELRCRLELIPLNCVRCPVCATKVRRQREDVSPLPTVPVAALDRIDRAILRALQRDASVSNVALAAKVHLSPPACLRRVDRLKALGLIRGIVALLEPRALGMGTLVVIGVVLDRSTPDSFGAFEKAVQKVSGCLECYVVTGEFDYFMVVRTQDNDSYNRLHAEQLLYLPGVRQIRTFMVLKQVLSTTQLPVAA